MNIEYGNAHSFHRDNFLTFAEWDPHRGMREYEFLLKRTNKPVKERPPRRERGNIYMLIGLLVGGIIGSVSGSIIGVHYFSSVGFWLGVIGGFIIGGIIGALTGSLIGSLIREHQQKKPKPF